MRRRRGANTVATIVATFLGSLLVHLLLWPVGDRLVGLAGRSPPIPLSGGVMEVSLVPDDADDEDDEKSADDVPDRVPPGKLVALDRIRDERPPDATDYVSEFDSRVDRETARRNAPNVAGDAARNPGDAPDANGATQPGPNMPSDARVLALGERVGQAERGEGAMADSPTAPDASDGTFANDPGAGAAGGGRPGLRGSPDAMKRTFGSAGSIDDLDGVDQGDETILNSRRWRFASFFNRVRNQTTQHWHPETVHRARDPEGKVYGTNTWTTRLVVRLNPDGSLNRISLDRASGLDFLDEEAIRALRAAQPFSNPPPQLVDPELGLIEFRFAFVFEVGGRARIFRYRN